MLMWIFAALIGVIATIGCMFFIVYVIIDKTFCDTLFEEIISVFLAMALLVGVVLLTIICFENAVSI